MNIDTIKISEFPDIGELSDIDISKSHIPIIFNGENYKFCLSNRYYSKAEIDKLILEVLGLTTSAADGKTLLSKINKFEEHINELQKGSLIDTTVKVSSESVKGYPEIYENYNALYTPLKANKIIISNKDGKLSASSIEADSVTNLNLLKDWSFKDNAGGNLTVAEKIKELESRIEMIEKSNSVGFIDYKSIKNLPIITDKNAHPHDVNGRYNYTEYNADKASWVFVQFLRGNGGDQNCGPRIWFKGKDESIDKFVEFTHISSYDYGQAAILLPVQPNTTVRIIAHGGNIWRAKAWPMT